MRSSGLSQRYSTDRRTSDILILEDEPLIGLEVEAFLVEAGFNVAMAASCAEAEKVLEELHPDAVVLDGRALPPLRFRTCLPGGCIVDLSLDGTLATLPRRHQPQGQGGRGRRQGDGACPGAERLSQRDRQDGRAVEVDVLFPVSLLQRFGNLFAKQLPADNGDVETHACALGIDHRDHRAAVGVFERVQNLVNDEVSYIGLRAGVVFHGLPPSRNHWASLWSEVVCQGGLLRQLPDAVLASIRISTAPQLICVMFLERAASRQKPSRETQIFDGLLYG
ncbi:response regulator [Mesorhizobium sp. B2-4-13]|nr:response regulator [Mesorhizobium sp. B2-4-13]